MLTGDGQIWVGPLGGRAFCPDCFHLWRSTGTRFDSATADRADSPQHLPPGSLPPMVRSWIDAVIEDALTRGAFDESALVTRMMRATADLRSVAEHRFLRHPDCSACLPQALGTGARGVMLPDPGLPLRATDLAEFGSSLIPEIVDARLGLVRHVTHRLTSRGLPCVAAALAPTEAHAPQERGYGRTGTTGASQVAAVMEAVERYTAMRDRGGRAFVRGSYQALCHRAVDPRSFILHDEAQRAEAGFHLSMWRPGQDYDWVWGHSLVDDRTVLVPEQLAYYAAQRRSSAAGARFVLESSNGCATGASLAEAALFGLLEVVERDAFLACWYSRAPLDRIDLDDCDDALVRALHARILAEGLELQAFALTGGVNLPAVALRLVDADNRLGPATVYAAAAHVTALGALTGALSELATFLQRHPNDGHADKIAKGLSLLKDPSLVRRMEDHVDQGWPAASIEARGFAEAARHILSWNAYADRYAPAPAGRAEALAHVVTRARAVCSDVILVDQSFPPLAERGLKCVKVLAPGLLPITFGHQYRRVSKARLDVVPGAPSRGRDGPYLPHPYS